MKSNDLSIDRLYWTRVQNNFDTDCYVDQASFDQLTDKLANPIVSKTMVDNQVHYDWVVYGNHNENNRGFDEVSEEY